MRVQILGKDPKSAIQTAERIPLSVKPQIETRPDYLSQLALAYYSTKRTDEGNRMLDRAMSAAAQSDPEGALNARLEVASALMDQPCWCRTWSSIQTSPGCMGSLLCQCGRRAPTLAQATPASDHAARAPVLPRRLCTFGDRLSALFVIPYRRSQSTAALSLV